MSQSVSVPEALLALPCSGPYSTLFIVSVSGFSQCPLWTISLLKDRGCSHCL